MEPFRHYILFGVVVLAYLHIAKACSIENVTNWFAPVSESILDTHRGIISTRQTSNIQEITNITPGEGLNSGPYVTLELANNNLILSTNNNFQNYEENETALMFTLTAQFRCSSGSTQLLVFTISVNDTNNNDPLFVPANNYEFTVAPPLPPGFLITDCVNDILVRDIDLTTERIDFAIRGSSLFEIAYDESSSIPKEFKAILKTNTFIRSLSEPIVFTISATDIDRTNDPPRTTNATVTILGNTEFELPDDLIFSKAFYLASYSRERGFVLQDKIYLRQGYDAQVNFTFQSEYSQYFELDTDENDVSFVSKELPEQLYEERQIYIVVEAEREHTSGATATVILQLPYESVGVIESFDKALYNGEVNDGTVNHETITVTGYNGSDVQLFGEYASIFEATLLGDKISVFPREAATLPTDISHTAVTLEAGRARSALLLKFISESKTEVTEKFDKILYNGEIENNTVSHETISITNFNGSNIQLLGDYASLFESSVVNGVVTVRARAATSLPTALTHLALTLQAGSAQSVLLFTFMSGSESEVAEHFDKILYEGKLENGVVTHDIITLSNFAGSTILLSGDHASSFEPSLSGGVVTVQLLTTAALPSELTHITLILQAGSARSVLSLNVISDKSEKSEHFDKILYNGQIENGILSHEAITLSDFTGSNILLTGDYASLFESSLASGVVTVRARAAANLPTDLTHLALTLQAGSSQSVLLLTFMSGSETEVAEYFDKILYEGKLENGVVAHDIITLSNFAGSTILLSGDHASSFEPSLSGGVVTVQLLTTAALPSELTHITLILQAGSARSVLSLNAISDKSEKSEHFDKIFYNGQIENGIVSHEAITLSDFTGSNILLTGDYASLFESSLASGVVTVRARAAANLPTDLTHLALTLQAGSSQSVLLLTFMSGSETEVAEYFDKILYEGKLENGVVAHDIITLSNFAGSTILLSGDYASSFEPSLSGGVVTVQLLTTAALPSELTHITLILQAGSARSVLSLNAISDKSEKSEHFDKIFYNGQIENGIVSHEAITLSDFTGSNILLTGDYASLFESSLASGVVTVRARAAANLPTDLTHLALTLQAGSSQSVLLLTFMSGSETEVAEYFDKILYEGKLENGVVAHDIITLSNFAGSTILLSGDYASSFEPSLSGGVVTVQLLTTAALPSELTHITLILQAGSARSVLSLNAISDKSEKSEHFDKILYNGQIENGIVSHEAITLSDFTGSNILLTGDYASLFESSLASGVVTVRARAAANLPTDLTHLALTLQAGSSQSVLLLTFMSESGAEVVEYFDKVLYEGKLENSAVSHDAITLSNFAGSNIVLSGDHASSFESSLSNGVVTVQLLTNATIPSELAHTTLVMQAGRARSVLSLDVIPGSTVAKVESFNEILYNGKFENSLISHDTILLSDYSGTNILLAGDYATHFESSLSSGVVSIRTISSPAFPFNLTYTTVTLRAGRAEAVLLLDIITSEDEDRPSVTFSSPSYSFWADVNQTGAVGRVQATETNGNTIIYSLNINDDNLKDRISVNNEGTIILLEAIEIGVHSFSVTATAQNTQASASVPVLIRVDGLPECKVGNGLSPLIVLERLEEEPHRNLVTLNRTEYQDCHYNLSNIWPEDQAWLYVDEDGLHATAIDREDKSIAFMTLSQIQVELRLHCDSDEAPATRRSLTAESLELSTDNYGSNKWILADTIVYNERRSFVNLIVIDINDNSPIFLGKENEPIYIGYPIPEIEEAVLPRALTELKATDADIGENAALIYSSLEDVLAVAPHTGLVHVRNNAKLQNNSRLTVYATDQNGRGRNGSLDIVVKLLDKHQIAVLTIRNSFLDDENLVMGDISKTIGYNLNVLRAVVISDSDEESGRKKRATSEPGASLQLYVYGLLENEPVDVTKLTNDITNSNLATVDIARVLSLQEHLEIIGECDAYTGLLAATIVLAVLLFLVILAIPLWFFLKWRKEQNYVQFSDLNSLASRDASEFPKIESITKPRLNIDELKRSERRLQEMLDVPIQDVREEPENDINIQKETPPVPTSTIVNFSAPEMPIVIQSIDKLKDNSDESDDNDEFGEQKQKPRKSVVTFNENVEKIIHLEDGIEDSPEPEHEIFKF